jgi:hypothetical protein
MPVVLTNGESPVATTFDLTVNDSTDGQTATDNTTTMTETAPAITPTPTPLPTPAPTPSPTPTPGLAIQDTTTGQPVPAVAQPYSGPVSGLTSEYVTSTTDSLNLSVSTPNWFIHPGSGNDAIAVSSGTNVLDGGTGSNFLTGGSGTDTFFEDDRGPTSDIWSIHSGDAATIWGVTPSDFTLSWVDGQGATGYTGLTLHATAAGVPTASLTLAGFTSADMNDGNLTVSFGTTAASGSVAGSNYMYVRPHLVCWWDHAVRVTSGRSDAGVCGQMRPFRNPPRSRRLKAGFQPGFRRSGWLCPKPSDFSDTVLPGSESKLTP